MALIASLYLNGDLLADDVSVLEDGWSLATCFVGDTSGPGTPPASHYSYDDVSVLRGGITEVLGNGGFEDPLLYEGPGLGHPVPRHDGNWYCQTESQPGVGRQAAAARSGSYGANVNVGTNKSGYFMQDLPDLQPGDLFTFCVHILPVVPGGRQLVSVVFDWDRGATGSTVGGVTVWLGATEIEFAGGFYPAPTPGEWNELCVRLSTSRQRRPHLGGLGFY